jgi:lipopolysaccharide/colanic/teichoic acid biosynthesis glycosyltransferase
MSRITVERVAIKSERRHARMMSENGLDIDSLNVKHRRPVREALEASSPPGSHLAHAVLAAILLVIAIPIIVLAAILVRCTSRGPAIYRQTRVGLHGRHFTMFKIRTMRCDAEALTGPVWATASDPRATWIGNKLRALHLDELPQLVNVIRGEMSLVGPRPERPEFTHRLALEIPGYLDRLAVRPGITGLAQINLPPDADSGSVCRKLVLDLAYIRRRSLWLDACILFSTALGPLRPIASGCRQALRVYYDPQLSDASTHLEVGLLVDPLQSNL